MAEPNPRMSTLAPHLGPFSHPSGPAAAASDEWLQVESVDLDGQGVAHRADGKVVFIEGALPNEQVRVEVLKRKNQWEKARPLERRRDSNLRVAPACPHFGVCGGCVMQHLHPAAQLAIKQRVLEDNLWHLGKVRPDLILRPLDGPHWGYRYRARLSVRHVARKGRVLVGFHERQSSYVADMSSCAVLPRQVSDLLPSLGELVAGMDLRDRLPQIELAVGVHVTVLVLRHLEPLTEADRTRLRAFAARYGVCWWLQPKGPDTAHPLDDDSPALTYTLPEFGIEMHYRPTDFTQVNHSINRLMVHRAVDLLDARDDERVIDWFCGLGNFTLPIATRAAQVLGIEGSEPLVTRSRENARLNGLQDRTSFLARNLFEMTPGDLIAQGPAHRWLVDPPREGAFALCKALADHVQQPLEGVAAWTPPRRIVYVSCNPSTLARDAGLLVHQAGYRCSAAGIINMFPHTAHVESIAVFDRD